MVNSIYTLLEQVKIINKKYDEIAQITGERFSIFNILGVERSEVATHSAIIGELLNPAATHGQGETFLNLFIGHLRNTIPGLEISNFSRASKTTVEKYTGVIDDNYSEGGRIDILVEDTRKALIIENKIDAGDQKKQLLRYYNYGVNNYDNFYLIYLTKNGSPAGDYSIGNSSVRESIINISYKSDILIWLELCKKEAASFPVLRETIVQYINLIKKLTNQTTNHKMSNDIKNIIISSTDNFLAASTIYDDFEKSKELIKNTFWEAVAEQIVDSLGSEWTFKMVSFWGVSFYKRSCDMVRISFDIKYLTNGTEIYLGILKYSPNQDRRLFYRKKLDKIGVDMGYQIVNEWWIHQKKITRFNLYHEETLKTILPLSRLKSNSLVAELVQAFNSYIREPKHLEYIAISGQCLNRDYEILTQVENDLRAHQFPFKTGIYEGYVLHSEIPLTHCTLVIDTLEGAGTWKTEVFLKNITNKSNTISPLFQEISKFEGITLSEERAIIKVYEQNQVAEITMFLVELGKELSSAIAVTV